MCVNKFELVINLVLLANRIKIHFFSIYFLKQRILEHFLFNETIQLESTSSVIQSSFITQTRKVLEVIYNYILCFGESV